MRNLHIIIPAEQAELLGLTSRDKFNEFYLVREKDISDVKGETIHDKADYLGGKVLSMSDINDLKNGTYVPENKNK